MQFFKKGQQKKIIYFFILICSLMQCRNEKKLETPFGIHASLLVSVNEESLLLSLLQKRQRKDLSLTLHGIL